MLIWLIRHGATPLSEARRYQGALDTPLSPNGRAALHRARLEPEKVYTSPMLRARETAALLFPAARQIPIADLREMDFGVFEGRSAAEMASDSAYRAWVESGCTAPCPMGEARDAFSARVCQVFASLADEALAAGERELVVVAHGGTQMAVLGRWGRPERDYFAWCSAVGAGCVLDASAWPEALTLIKEISFTE
ncbi:MAG: histidine phosphatase family protein [Oscillospiraceae bacterium]|nr:histidine phosphatase family protein [Oscillospiraceae bacterium]